MLRPQITVASAMQFLSIQLSRMRLFYRLMVFASRRTVLAVLDHDCLNLAQSCAYSAIVALFPTLIVAAAIVGLLPDTAPMRLQLSLFFARILPPGVAPLLDIYFQNTPNNTHSIRALISAGIVSFLGATSVMVTLMDGLRRARGLPEDCWTFWQRRRRAAELAILSLVPMTVASAMVVFGHIVTRWLWHHLGTDVRGLVVGVALVVRWSVALGASVGLIALIYHLGVPGGWHQGVPGAKGWKRSAWRDVMAKATSGSVLEEPKKMLDPHAWIPMLPGAIMATAMWFLTTLAFGWYVTRLANYSEVYGSLGAGIALLFWLYLISLSVLSGAEFNAQFHLHLVEQAQTTKERSTGEAAD